jgi:hypothetical protein
MNYEMLEVFVLGWMVGTLTGAAIISFFVGARINEERIRKYHD